MNDSVSPAFAYPVMLHCNEFLHWTVRCYGTTRPRGELISSLCGVVQPLHNGRYGFNIKIDGEPLGYLVVEFEMRAKAQGARDAVCDLLNAAIAVTPSSA